MSVRDALNELVKRDIFDHLFGAEVMKAEKLRDGLDGDLRLIENKVPSSIKAYRAPILPITSCHGLIQHTSCQQQCIPLLSVAMQADEVRASQQKVQVLASGDFH